MLGGVLVEFASWEWIFIINVPLGIIGVLLAALAIVTLVLMTMLRPREELHGNRGA